MNFKVLCQVNISLSVISSFIDLVNHPIIVLLDRKMNRIKVKSRVSTEAWRFDRSEKEEERWSFLYFGGTWVDSRVYGTVTGKTGERWLVKWDIDEEISSWETEVLLKESDDTPYQIVQRDKGTSFNLISSDLNFKQSVLMNKSLC